MLAIPPLFGQPFLPWAVSGLGTRARIISTRNIVFSILILSVLIPGALIGVLTVVAAVFAHEVAELLAVANGLRVARQRP